MILVFPIFSTIFMLGSSTHESWLIPLFLGTYIINSYEYDFITKYLKDQTYLLNNDLTCNEHNLLIEKKNCQRLVSAFSLFTACSEWSVPCVLQIDSSTPYVYGSEDPKENWIYIFAYGQNV